MRDIILFLKDKRNFGNLLVLVLILISLPIGVNLVHREQELKSLAAQGDPIDIQTEGDGTGIDQSQVVILRSGNQVIREKDGATSVNFGVKLNSTLNKTAALSNPQKFARKIEDSLIPTVYADIYCPPSVIGNPNGSCTKNGQTCQSYFTFKNNTYDENGNITSTYCYDQSASESCREPCSGGQRAPAQQEPAAPAPPTQQQPPANGGGGSASSGSFTDKCGNTKSNTDACSELKRAGWPGDCSNTSDLQSTYKNTQVCSTTTTQPTAISGTCTPNATAVNSGQAVTWTVTPTGGSGNYTYSWQGSPAPSGGFSTSNTQQMVYKNVSGTDTQAAAPTVTVSNADGSGSKSITCTPAIVVHSITTVGYKYVILNDNSTDPTTALAAATQQTYSGPDTIYPITLGGTAYPGNDITTPAVRYLYVQFIGSDGTTVKRETKTLTIVPPDPVITGTISCGIDIANSGVSFSIPGKYFGSSTPQSLSITPAGGSPITVNPITYGPNLLTANISGSNNVSDFTISMKRSDGVSSVTTNGQQAQCHVGATTISVNTPSTCPTLASINSSQPISNVDFVAIEANNSNARAIDETLSVSNDGKINIENGQNQRVQFQQGKKYKLSVKLPRFLRRTFAVPSEGQSLSTATFNAVLDKPLFFGAIAPQNHGDAINEFDHDWLISHWGKLNTTTTFLPENNPDLNGDGVVNSLDWACMKLSYGKQSDGVPGPDSTPTPASTSAHLAPNPVAASAAGH